TGARTLDALRALGAQIEALPVLRDVDHESDLRPVAAECAPGSRFRDAVHRYAPGDRVREEMGTVRRCGFLLGLRPSGTVKRTPAHSTVPLRWSRNTVV
ncbi:MAG: hypothetical protein WBA81_06315, partial [Rhodococcus sp. (in: high G+C Gram-positive bacteria)]